MLIDYVSRIAAQEAHTRPALVGIKEAMLLTGLGRTSIYKLAKQRVLRPVHVGRRTFFLAREFDAWIDNLPREAGND